LKQKIKIEKLEFDDLFHYPNAKIIYKNKLWDIHSLNFVDGNIKLFREVQYDILVAEDVKYFNEEANISECQLQLRSTDQLTESEMKKCSDITFWYYDGETDEWNIMNKYGSLNRGLSKIDRDLADYLCSINVCIHLEMFNNGKAVKYVC